MAKIALKKRPFPNPLPWSPRSATMPARSGLPACAYSRLGTEGSDYFKELVKAGEALEKKANRWSQVRSIQ